MTKPLNRWLVLSMVILFQLIGFKIAFAVLGRSINDQRRMAADLLGEWEESSTGDVLTFRADDTYERSIPNDASPLSGTYALSSFGRCIEMKPEYGKVDLWRLNFTRKDSFRVTQDTVYVNVVEWRTYRRKE